jgi:multidrug resistance efflux pump
MHSTPRRVLPVVLVIALLGAAAYFFLPRLLGAGDQIVSGTIEAREVQVASELGGRVVEVAVDEGDAVRLDDLVAELHQGTGARPSSSATERVRSPIDGVVLYRAVEPGEVVAPAANLLTIADLTDLTLTVYVPEDRYGRITLGQAYPVTVDSFPGEVFTGTVSYIADKAEFTPRNVQTTASRKTTVFAIRLDLADGGGRLKPGMPADVQFPLAN